MRKPIRIFTAMPSDTNPDGDIFGGKIVSEMDLACLAVARRTCNGRAATVAIDTFKFIQPIKVGDEVIIYADLVKRGRTSMTIKACTYKMTGQVEDEVKVCEALFTFVHIDHDGKPAEIKWMN